MDGTGYRYDANERQRSLDQNLFRKIIQNAATIMLNKIILIHDRLILNQRVKLWLTAIFPTTPYAPLSPGNGCHKLFFEFGLDGSFVCCALNPFRDIIQSAYQAAILFPIISRYV